MMALKIRSGVTDGFLNPLTRKKYVAGIRSGGNGFCVFCLLERGIIYSFRSGILPRIGFIQYSPIYGCYVCLEMKYKECSGGPPSLGDDPHRRQRAAYCDLDDYHRPDEKPPGGMRFLLMTWPEAFSDGTVVLISAAPPDLYPSPVTGLPFL